MAVILAIIAARRADPREHGRQAARSKRVRPKRARDTVCQSARAASPQAARLISL
jgi:hypothetical protein